MAFPAARNGHEAVHGTGPEFRKRWFILSLWCVARIRVSVQGARDEYSSSLMISEQTGCRTLAINPRQGRVYHPLTSDTGARTIASAFLSNSSGRT